jgi:hypothetical protein
MENKIDPTATPLVLGKGNNVLYKYNGGTSFTNLKTKVTGEIELDKANSLFSFPLGLNEIVLKYPNVVKMLETFGGSVEVVSNDGNLKCFC